MNIPWDEIEEFFFEGMVDGWVSGREPEDVPDMPGYKQYCHKRGNLSLIDRFGTTPFGHQSGGFTVIWMTVNEITFPVWQMNFWGWYLPQATDIVKAALHSHYSGRIFLGGRGPELYSMDDLDYSNACAGGSSFTIFHGLEKVWHRNSGMIMGEHFYGGRALGIKEI